MNISDANKPKLVFLGSFTGGLPNIFEISAELVQQKIEQARRETEAAKAKLQEGVTALDETKD
jgi:hypothetical protein